MTDNQVNAIILIRQNAGSLNLPTSDAELLKLVALGDELRASMTADIEVEYDELQQLAIYCSTHYEMANDSDLIDFDFEAFDRNFEKEFLEV